MTARRLKHWGWGYEDQAPSAAELRAAAQGIREQSRIWGRAARRRARWRKLSCAAPGCESPERARRSVQRRALRAGSSRRWARPTATWCGGFEGSSQIPPTWSRFPAMSQRSRRCWSWSEAEGAAVMPFGGGTSVVGGVEARARGSPRCLASTCAASTGYWKSMPARSRRGSRLAPTGPGLEAQLREHGLTLRHFPQSFEYSTLGGWIATRAGGHFATL